MNKNILNLELITCNILILRKRIWVHKHINEYLCSYSVKVIVNSNFKTVSDTEVK